MSANTSLERPAPTGDAPRSAKVAWIVIGITIAFGCAMGVFLFLRAKSSDIALRQWMHTYDTRGSDMSAVDCVHDVIHWFDTQCDAPAEMCLQAVPMGVAHCLHARDRKDECTAVGADLKDEKWGFRKCKEMGIDKSSKKAVTKSCTAAWDALDTFCKSHQQGVVL